MNIELKDLQVVVKGHICYAGMPCQNATRSATITDLIEVLKTKGAEEIRSSEGMHGPMLYVEEGSYLVWRLS